MSIESPHTSFSYEVSLSYRVTASERLRHHEWPIDLEPSHGKMGVLVKETSEKARATLYGKRQPPLI